MENMYYIGLDVHKKTISYCVKDGSGRIYAEAEIPATRLDLDIWMKTLPQPWTAAMEATIFTAWIYDHLLPHAAAVPPTRHLVRVGWLPGKNAGTSTGQETARSDRALLSVGRTRLTEG